MDWMSQYLKDLRAYARDYVLENTGLKVLALLITGVLWLSVASRPVSQMTLNGVPIQLFNLATSPNPLTVSKYDTLTARVYLDGPRDVLDALRAGQITVTADMSNVESGVRVIQLTVEPNSLPANVRVKEIEPRSIRVTVERVIVREVPIVPRFEGEPRAGYEVIDWKITPATVRIGGAESQVRDITEVSTETVRLSDRVAPFSDTVAIDIGSPNLSISDDSGRKVMLQVNIGEVRKERVIDNVPVTLLGAPRRARPNSRFVKVTVYGASSTVDAITAADVSAEIDYHAGSVRFTPKVTLSPDLASRVVVRSVEPQMVRVR
jgi:YbbR domain-containing protein